MRDPILVLRLSALGDILHTLPAVVSIRRSSPGAQIGWVVEKAYRELLALVAPVDEIFEVSTNRWRRELIARSTWSDLAHLRSRLTMFSQGGIAIDFQGLVKSATLGWISGAEERFGFDRSTIREPLARLFLNREASVDPSRHVVEQNLALASAALGERLELSPPDLSPFPDDPRGVLGALRESRPVLLIPGAGKLEKRWGVERFSILARQIRENFPCEVAIAWGPGEEPLADAISGASGATKLPPTSLRELAYALQSSRLAIGGDTGPLHLAAAMGVPVIGLYGPSSARRNGPWGQLERCIEVYGTTKRMSDIEPGVVSSLAREILGASAGHLH